MSFASASTEMSTTSSQSSCRDEGPTALKANEEARPSPKSHFVVVFSIRFIVVSFLLASLLSYGAGRFAKRVRQHSDVQKASNGKQPLKKSPAPTSMPQLHTDKGTPLPRTCVHHLWDVLNPKTQALEQHHKSIGGDGSYESLHPEHFQCDRVVALDDVMQSRRHGEIAYHESLVHPAMFAFEDPERVAIIGGGAGAGATLREVLKHKTVEEVVMIKIDEIMVNTSRTSFPDWSDCSNLVGSTPSCFDDPRTKIVFDDAMKWLINRYYAVNSTAEDDLFDVIIVDALYPNLSVEFSDIFYDDENLMTALHNALSSDGILVVQVGEANQLNDPPEVYGSSGHIISLIRNLVEVGFEAIVDFDESHSRSGSPWRFFVAMMNDESLSNWLSNEAQLDLLLRQRMVETKDGDIPVKFYDGATHMSLEFPNRISEEVYCRSVRVSEICKEGRLDPDVPNYPASSFEVKRSGVGEQAGRGVFAKKAIAKDSYLAIDEYAHKMYVPPLTFELLENMYLALDLDYLKKFVDGYIDGYGWFTTSFGKMDALVDQDITTFVNHGCNGTHNIGDKYAFQDAAPSSELSTDDAYDPILLRVYPCGFDGSTSHRDIQEGEELLDNYLAFGSYKHWKENADEIEAMCGAGVGSVTQYENAVEEEKE